jgi:hypothetical protein
MLICLSACMIQTFDERMKPLKYAMYSLAGFSLWSIRRIDSTSDAIHFDAFNIFAS